MQERLTILKNFRAAYNWSDSQVNRWLKPLIILKLLIVTSALVIVPAIVIADLVNVDLLFGWEKSALFVIVTLSTVGYGDIVPHSIIGKYI